MEEMVGKLWHRFITRRARQGYPQAGVTLDEVRGIVSVLFRALGGETGLRVEAAMPDRNGFHQGLLQRLAGTCQTRASARRDDEVLWLPAYVDCFPTQALNRDLYLWLAALAAMDEGESGDWLLDNQRRTRRVLASYPGMRVRYRNLVEAELAQRPSPERLPPPAREQETIIQAALRQPGEAGLLPEADRPPMPVSLWLYPAPLVHSSSDTSGSGADDEEDDAQEGHSHVVEQRHRYRAQQTEMPDGKDGLIAMRWENIFSWAEYIKVNRATDDDDDEDAGRTAQDMERLTVARDRQAGRTRLRLDLDLPAAEYDDTPLSGDTTLPEWDWSRQQLVADHCVVRHMLPRGSMPKPLPESLRPVVRRLRGQFSVLAKRRIWQGRQQEGCEFDLGAYVDYHVASRTRGCAQVPALYRDLRENRGDLATLLLADLSLSTDAAVNDEQRVIDVIRDGLLLFNEALSASGDRYALYGFSSRRREQVRIYPLKRFDEACSDRVRGHIQAIRPGYYTRMGAAVRRAAQILGQQAAQKRLLLILTDGKPNDLDCYEGRYGIEDSRVAIREARQMGLVPFCITIDSKADAYLPYLFGRDGYAFIRRPQELPRKLVALYARLTGAGE